MLGSEKEIYCDEGYKKDFQKIATKETNYFKGLT